MSKEQRILMVNIIPFITTFLGAGLAFLFQNIRENRKRTNENYSALLKTQALFYQYQEVVYSIKKDFLDKFKNDLNRTAKVQHISFCKSFAELDYEGLSFILEDKKNVDLYGNITNAYRKCISAIDSIKERNHQYRKITNGKVESMNQETRKCIVSVSPADLKYLLDFTDIMYREVDQVLHRITEIDEELQKFIKGYFKKKYALKMKIADKTSK